MKIGKVSSNLRFGKSTPILDRNGRAQYTGSASPVEVMNVLITAKGGRMITNYKSQAFESGSIVSEKPATLKMTGAEALTSGRKLTRVEDLLSADELAMYTEFCRLADMA